MTATVAPDRYASAAEALEAARAGLAFLANADAGSLTSAERAELVRGLAAVGSVHLAASSSVLAAFRAQEDYAADGSRAAKTWVAWQTRTTAGAAGTATGWAARLERYRYLAAALAAGRVSPAFAGWICRWLGRLPAGVREQAEKILVDAAAGGTDGGEAYGGTGLAGLAGLFEQLRAATAAPDVDDADEEKKFGSRSLRLDAHFDGHGALSGNLTPEAVQLAGAVFDTLGRPAGPEDDRTLEQRQHDALVEALTRLVAADFLPQRAGQPVQLSVHVTLSQLLGLAETDPGLAALLRARGLAAPPGAGCDAQVVPHVSGDLDPAVLEELTRRYLDGTSGSTNGTTDDSDSEGSEADSLVSGSSSDIAGSSSGLAGLPADAAAPAGAAAGYGAPGSTLPAPGSTLPGSGGGLRGFGLPGYASLAADGLLGYGSSLAGGCLPGPGLPGLGGAEPGAGGLEVVRRAAAMRVIADAVRLLSGPNGLAAWLRGRYAAGPAGGRSLPLDIGAAKESIPTHLRRLVAARDGHCRFGGCAVQAPACQVHHVRYRADGGSTSLDNLVLLCRFHHGQVVHRRGWSFALHADGSTTATRPDGLRVVHGDSPPAPAAA